MGMTVYSKVKDLINSLNVEELTLPQLQALVMRHIGSMDSTVRNAIKTMNDTGLIKDIGDGKFKITRK